jgi:hypothetical protein
MEVLELVADLNEDKLCTESYKLFLAIMDTADSDDRFRRPAELSLIGAFKWGTLNRPHVGDPTSLLRFLEYCLLEQEKGVAVDVPVERIMLALAGAPIEVISDGIAKFDFTLPLFFNGICRALGSDVPYHLRRATNAFLRHLDAQFFNTNKTFSAAQVDAFISGWSSSAQELLKKEPGRFLNQSLFSTLMGMLDSPFWREHIPKDQWNILTLLGPMPKENIPPSFFRCVNNPTIIPHMERAGYRGRTILVQWAAISWAKYPDLSEEVRSQLENATKVIMDGPAKGNLATYESIVEGQIKQIGDKIDSHASRPFGEDVAELRKRQGLLRTARGALISIQKIPF